MKGTRQHNVMDESLNPGPRVSGSESQVRHLPGVLHFCSSVSSSVKQG